MSAVVEFVEDVVGGVVEAVGDVVESVVDVVKDVGRAIDDYVIQPILDDPLSAIATVAGAYFLGPAAAQMFGVQASVGAGIAAGAANTAAGLVQGEDFDEAIKGGLAAGVGTWGSAELASAFGGGPSPTPTPADSLDDFLAANNNFDDVLVSAAVPDAPVNVGAPIPNSSVAPTALAPLDDVAAASVDDALVNTAAAPSAPAAAPAAPQPLETLTSAADDAAAAAANPQSPLQTLKAPTSNVDIPTFSSGLDASFTPDYNLASGIKPSTGLQAPKFSGADAFDIYGNPSYSIAPPGVSGGPGLQMPSAPNLGRMGGGQGLTVDVEGLPAFRYSDTSLDPSLRGQTDSWQTGSKTYGLETPDVTVSSTGIRPTPDAITYDATTNMGTPSAWDQITSGDLTGAAKNLGGQAVDWAKANPWTAAGVGLTALQGLSSPGGPPSATPPPRGSTRDANFNKSLDLYNYMRDRANYGGDLARYGQTGGEHTFFQNTRFVPIPIPGQEPTPAKMGGLIQMKRFAQGGMAEGMQDPRRAQLMAAMAQQHPAGQGGQMPQGRGQMPQGRGALAQARAPMPQGGMMPGRPMVPQNTQGMPQQARPQAPMRPRDPRTAYYQYGNPPPQAKAMGGLSQVHSMKIGGGADGRSDDVNAVLSDGEYVFDAESVAMLGNGSSKAGAKKLDDMRAKIRQHKGKALAGGKISPDAKSPLAYLKGA